MVKDVEFVNGFKEKMEDISDLANSVYAEVRENLNLMCLDELIIRVLNGCGLYIHKSLVGTAIELLITNKANEGFSYLEQICEKTGEMIDDAFRSTPRKNVVRLIIRLKHVINENEAILVFNRKDIDELSILIAKYKNAEKSVYDFTLRDNVIYALINAILLRENNWDKLGTIVNMIKDELNTLGFSDLIPEFMSEMKKALSEYIDIDFENGVYTVKKVNYEGDLKKDVLEAAKMMHFKKE